MLRAKYALGILLIIAVAGCTKTTQEQANQQPPSEAQQQAAQPEQQRAAPTGGVPSTGSTHAPAPPTQESTPAPKPPEPKFAAVPGGTSIQVRLQTALDSGVNKSGDTFSAVLDKDIDVNGSIVAARGCAMAGRILHAEQSGRVEGRAKLSIQLTSLTVNGQAYPLQTETLSFEAEATKKKDATKVGIGAGVGTIIGAIAGGGKGAAIGAAVGAGAGGAVVVSTRGKEVKFDVEQKFNFVLSNGISIKLP